MDSFGCSLSLFYRVIFFSAVFFHCRLSCQSFSSWKLSCFPPQSDLKICTLYTHRLSFIQYWFRLFKMYKAFDRIAKKKRSSNEKIMVQENQAAPKSGVETKQKQEQERMEFLSKNFVAEMKNGSLKFLCCRQRQLRWRHHHDMPCHTMQCHAVYRICCVFLALTMTAAVAVTATSAV